MCRRISENKERIFTDTHSHANLIHGVQRGKCFKGLGLGLCISHISVCISEPSEKQTQKASGGAVSSGPDRQDYTSRGANIRLAHLHTGLGKAH